MIAPPPRFRLYTNLPMYLSAISALLTGRLQKGNYLEDFQDEMLKLTGAQYAIPVPMARTGIYLCIKNLVKPGQKVLLSPYTIVDVINMVQCADGIPVFVDIDSKTCNISANKLSELIDNDCAAVLITHLHGLSCDLSSISQICKEHNVPLLEDSAQAFGATYQGKMLGTHGTAGVYSFGAYKNLNCFVGGMVLTSDLTLYEKIINDLTTFPSMSSTNYLKRIIKAAIMDFATFKLVFSLFTYWLFREAFLRNISAINNFTKVDVNPVSLDQIPEVYTEKMSAFQAKLLLKQLSTFTRDAKKRFMTAKIYIEGLSDIPDLIIPPFSEDGSHCYTYFPIQLKNREDLMRFCLKKKRDFVLGHYRNCAELDIFKKYNGDCPNASATSRNTIFLPVYPNYPLKQAKRNVEVIREFFGV